MKYRNLWREIPSHSDMSLKIRDEEELYHFIVNQFVKDTISPRELVCEGYNFCVNQFVKNYHLAVKKKWLSRSDKRRN